MMGCTSSASARMLNCVMMLANRYYSAERQPRTRLLPPEAFDSSSVEVNKTNFVTLCGTPHFMRCVRVK